MIHALLEERNLPPIWDGTGDWESRRTALKELLQREEYGFMPPPPKEIRFETVKEDTSFCAGKAILRKVIIHTVLENGTFSFPIYASLPTDDAVHPFFVHINFRDAVPDQYQPTEEICDSGFAVLSFCYQDVTNDRDDFTDGLAGVLYGGRARTGADCGKIAMWAWAAQRVLDYAQTLPCLDMKNAAVIGHSRLGKTALLTAATDERFRFAFSNDSGCSGASISRKNQGETIDNICRSFPHWFCPNYQKYRQNEDTLPFDQHTLLSLIAPRHVYVASASLDDWADPINEYLSCCAANEVYRQMGMAGFEHPDRLPEVGECFHDGAIGYHLRAGKHYLGREDWQYDMAYVKKHMI